MLVGVDVRAEPNNALINLDGTTPATSVRTFPHSGAGRDASQVAAICFFHPIHSSLGPGRRRGFPYPWEPTHWHRGT